MVYSRIHLMMSAAVFFDTTRAVLNLFAGDTSTFLDAADQFIRFTFKKLQLIPRPSCEPLFQPAFKNVPVSSCNECAHIFAGLWFTRGLPRGSTSSLQGTCHQSGVKYRAETPIISRPSCRAPQQDRQQDLQPANQHSESSCKLQRHREAYCPERRYDAPPTPRFSNSLHFRWTIN